MVNNKKQSQSQLIQKYYQFQSSIYDLTRWSFLFGRKKVFTLLPQNFSPKEIIEIGCGTGKNLITLAEKFPHAHIIGVDISQDMLEIAKKKTAHLPNISLSKKPYCSGIPTPNAPDLILFSYMLTMVNSQYAQFILQAFKDLRKGGKIAIIDFHSSRNTWFKKHMKNHHVRMEGHMDELLHKMFQPIHFKKHNAYGGIWKYFFFIGEKTKGY